MAMYAAFDLHATNSYLAIIDGEGVPVFKGKLRNEWEILRSALGPYEEGIEGVVVESTFNWYWLVDSPMEAGYQVHLANPCAIPKYRGLKHCDDNSDAVWLDRVFRRRGMDARIIMLIHDAIWVEAPTEEEKEARRLMNSIMSTAGRSFLNLTVGFSH